MGSRRETCRKFIYYVLILTVHLLFYSCKQEQKNTPLPLNSERSKAGIENKATLEKILVTEQDTSFRIVLAGSQPLPYIVFQLSVPPTLIVDLPGTELKLSSEDMLINNGTIKRIKKTVLKSKDQISSRLMIELEKMSDYHVRQEEAQLLIDINKEENNLDLIAQEKSNTILQKEEPIKALEVVNLSINPQKESLQIIIQANGKIEKYRTFTLNNPTRLVIDINNALYDTEENFINVDSPFLQKIRFGNNVDMTRFVFDFPGEIPPPFHVTKNTDKIIVSIAK